MNLFIINSKSNLNFMKFIADFFFKKKSSHFFLFIIRKFKKKNILNDSKIFLSKDLLNKDSKIKIKSNFVKYFFIYGQDF